ncbi:MAG TPA: hypothetical protein VMZ30_21805 [Pyrinomonadaceae bacterium]|nr:hypothetical protein [Pyrinomonadaceae bacterium]
MNSAIVLTLDRSTPARLCLERNGSPVEIEEAFVRGFQITGADANAVLTLVARFVESRDRFQK